ncbi:uncharacterized protein BDR25DRAFT_289187 [Lindgomyces ingoldianus]|uniref:Uncharacterized protein n=1 Tax=Lindgomyces ingoldianus TaxID=673940 RepID=A0ACB6QSE3_9PLEO|nr:uncharacterized protein BDR25DRAFT_289187 [Lindgomyces ingoldianus]KAF2469025.1 hypothetical protein BDR25DRAFT_289187 [Lindgomyces ingoldianus]
MGPKRASEGDIVQASKIPKIEHGIASSPLLNQQPRAPNNDFSGSVKKKLANSTRTGQACDRCKVRKIRCDGRPEGCSPCAQNRTLCKTTDRITGRATTRGQVEAMEAENGYLRAQVAELQAQLKELGVEPRTVPAYNGFPPSSIQWPASGLSSDGGQGWVDASQRRTSTSPLPGYVSGPNVLEGTEYRPLPQFKPGSIGDNYLGVSSADSLLSHIKGTSLSVFGTEIDITDFVQNEEEYDKSVMSYNHFLKVALNDEPQVEPVAFPEYQQLSEYAGWYLRSLNPYTMLLDKPEFMHLIWKIGNEANFTPSAAEIVCVHMMLATLKYQISVRNHEESLMEESHKHYRYSLSFFNELLHGHGLKDLQALGMITVHLRNFPKPGAAWIMCSTTFLLAVELGLHRSTKAWAETAKLSKHEIEMRKRVFWTMHALTTNLSGKLGRPMPINMEDVDVEFPEPLNDCLPGEDTSLVPFRKCSFHVGIQTVKYTVWSSELYRTVYSVRSSSRGYEDTVRRLENGIRQWREECPPELMDPARAAQENYIFALYLDTWDNEFQLLLHHPAVCRSTDPEFINANLDKCLAASQKMLYNCNEMRKMRSMDIPWINSVVYIAAIFTTLFIYIQRKDRMKLVEMTKLKGDMALWIEIMGEAGALLGSGDKLKKAIHKIVDQLLNGINDSIVKRTATESLARVDLQGPQETSPPTSVYGNGNNFHEQYSGAASGSTDPGLSVSSGPYATVPPGASFSYSSATTVSVPPYQQSTAAFSQQPYSSGDDPGMTPSHAAALAAAASGAPSQRPNDNFIYANANAQVANNGQQPPYPANQGSPNDWRQWTRTFMHQLGPSGEYLNTANTLMALGGREGSAQGPGQDGPGTGDGSAVHGLGPSNFQWPGIVFGMGPGSNGHVGQQ